MWIGIFVYLIIWVENKLLDFVLKILIVESSCAAKTMD